VKKYDCVIIGSGPGGYEAALYLAQSGKKIALVEKRELGGVCLNVGCIPTKSFVASAKAFYAAKNSAAFGFTAGNVELDFNAVSLRAADVVLKLKKGIEYLLKQRKVDLIKGEAFFVDKNTVTVNGESITGDFIIIATGSSPSSVPVCKIDERSILSSSGALSLRALPKSIAIVGGGFIGCEFASIFSKFGSNVTLIEMKDRLLPESAAESAKRLEIAFKKKGINVQVSRAVEKIEYKDNGNISVVLSGEDVIESEKVMVSVGRRPNVDGLGLDKAGVVYSAKGINIDPSMRTNIPNIYAIGDCTGKIMLAHVASGQGFIASKNILGESSAMEYHAVPFCVFTDPEIAICGITEERAIETGINTVSAKFNFTALGKAHAAGNTEGFLKLVYLRENGTVIGAEIMGENAGEIIDTAAVAISKKLTVQDLSETIHAHPTMAEAFGEAAHKACGRPIHTI